MSLVFYIAHTTHGRTRLGWAGDKEQKHRVNEVAKQLELIDGILSTEPRLTTGSIIIEHPETSWTEILPLVEQHGTIRFCPAPAQTPARSGLQTLNTGLDRIDAVLRKETQNGMDLRNLTFILLVMMALVQSLRGQVMVSAASFLWFALNVGMLSPSDKTGPEDSSAEE